MPDRVSESDVRHRAPDTANPGLVRPPFVYLISIGVGLMVHYFWPARVLPGPANTLVGVMLVVGAVALFNSAVRTFRKAGTAVPGNQPASAIVRSGPYAFTRNPIYLAFTLFQLGIAAWLNSLAVLLMLIPALALMTLVVIPREERYLEARFPSEYMPYKRSVRRWI